MSELLGVKQSLGVKSVGRMAEAQDMLPVGKEERCASGRAEGPLSSGPMWSQLGQVLGLEWGIQL